MGSLYHTLVQAGFWKDVVAWLVGMLLGTFWVKWGFQRKINAIADRLDTATEGGLETIHKDLAKAAQVTERLLDHLVDSSRPKAD